jgi:hypothetical protein
MTVTIFSDIKKRVYLVCHGALEIACYDVLRAVTVMPTHFDVQKRKYHPSTLARSCENEAHTGPTSLPGSPQRRRRGIKTAQLIMQEDTLYGSGGYRTTLCGE